MTKTTDGPKPPTTKRPKGRPTLFTKQRRDRILAAVRAGAYREQAALANGISVTTFYEWINQGRNDIDAGRTRTPKAEFAEAIARADAEAEVQAIAELRRGARDRQFGDQSIPGDWRAAEAFLRARSPERWSQHRDLTKLMERRLELEERMQERLALAFEASLAALVAAGVAITAAQRQTAVVAYAGQLEALEAAAPIDQRQIAA